MNLENVSFPSSLERYLLSLLNIGISEFCLYYANFRKPILASINSHLSLRRRLSSALYPDLEQNNLGKHIELLKYSRVINSNKPLDSSVPKRAICFGFLQFRIQ